MPLWSYPSPLKSVTWKKVIAFLSSFQTWPKTQALCDRRGEGVKREVSQGNSLKDCFVNVCRTNCVIFLKFWNCMAICSNWLFYDYFLGHQLSQTCYIHGTIWMENSLQLGNHSPHNATVSFESTECHTVFFFTDKLGLKLQSATKWVETLHPKLGFFTFY